MMTFKVDIILKSSKCIIPTVKMDIELKSLNTKIKPHKSKFDYTLYYIIMVFLSTCDLLL